MDLQEWFCTCEYFLLYGNTSAKWRYCSLPGMVWFIILNWTI